MSLLRLRLTGTADNARGLVNTLASIDGVEHVEEVADLMPHLDDEDSSSAGLNADGGGSQTYLIEVDVPNETAAGRVRLLAQGLASATGSALELEDDEAWGENTRIDTDRAARAG